MARAYYAIVLILLCGLTVQAQSAKEMRAEIEGKWELDDSDNATLLKVIEVPSISKCEIFDHVFRVFCQQLQKWQGGNPDSG